MADFVNVVEAGKGWTKVRDEDGNEYKLEGSRNWRNNNPGNIEYGEFARSMGAIGSDGRFAVFPNYDTGRAAKEGLLFDSSRYNDLTLAEAISRYAPPNENNTNAYIRAITQATGVSPNTRMRDIPPAVRPNILSSMERVEGYKVGKIYDGKGQRVPPAEIPNVVATRLDVTRPTPRVAPAPVTMSPDLGQMRNPATSITAQRAQVSPLSNPPLPQARPSAPDIVTPTMERLARHAGNVNATRAVDMLAASQNPVTPRLTPAGDNIYSYHIPDMTPTVVTGGLGSLTPMANTPARARLPDIAPPSTPTPTRTTAQIRADNGQTRPVTDREIATARGTTVATVPTAPISTPQASPRLPDASVKVAQMVQRPELQTALNEYVQRQNAPRMDDIGSMPKFGDMGALQFGTPQIPGPASPPKLGDRLTPGRWGVDAIVPNMPIGPVAPIMVGAPQIAPMPVQRMANIPLPRPRPVTPIQRMPVQPMPRMAAPSPLRITVNGAGSYGVPQPVNAMTPVQRLQAQGLSAAQAYDALNRAAAGPQTVEDRVRGGGGNDSGIRSSEGNITSAAMFPMDGTYSISS